MPIHSADALERHLPPTKHLGLLSEDSISPLNRHAVKKRTKDELRVEQAKKRMPPLSRILNLEDIEVCCSIVTEYDIGLACTQAVGEQVLSHKAFAYYVSASDDEISMSRRYLCIGVDSRIQVKARTGELLADSFSSLGSCVKYQSAISLPLSLDFTPPHRSSSAVQPLQNLGIPMVRHRLLFISCKWINFEVGEANITKGAFQRGIIQMVSSNASMSAAEIMEVAHPSQTLFFQLYKHRNDKIAAERVREVERLGYKAIFLTVDAVVAGNRERDIRSPWVLEAQENGPVYLDPDGNNIIEEVNVLGTAGALIANDDRDMTWEKV